MEQSSKQGYRMHHYLSNLNRLDVDRLDDARIESESRPRVNRTRKRHSSTSRRRGHSNVTAPTTPPTVGCVHSCVRGRLRNRIPDDHRRGRE